MSSLICEYSKSMLIFRFTVSNFLLYYFSGSP